MFFSFFFRALVNMFIELIGPCSMSNTRNVIIRSFPHIISLSRVASLITKCTNEIIKYVFTITGDVAFHCPNFTICCSERSALLKVQIANFAVSSTEGYSLCLLFFVGDEFSIGNLSKDVWWLPASMDELYIVECCLYPCILRILNEAFGCVNYVAAFKIAVVG